MTSSFGDGVTVVDQAAVYVVQPKCRCLSTTRRERNGAHPAPPGPSLTGHGTGPLLALVRWVRVAQFQRSRWNTAIHHGRLAALVNLQTRRIHFPLFVPLGFVFDFLPKTISMKFFPNFLRRPPGQSAGCTFVLGTRQTVPVAVNLLEQREKVEMKQRWSG